MHYLFLDRNQVDFSIEKFRDYVQVPEEHFFTRRDNNMIYWSIVNPDIQQWLEETSCANFKMMHRYVAERYLPPSKFRDFDSMLHVPYLEFFSEDMMIVFKLAF